MLKLVLVLLGLKFLLPSGEQRKKRKKAKARRKRIMWLVSLLGGKKLPAKAAKPVKKKMSAFRKIKLAVKALVFICISIPLVDLALKGAKLGQKVYGMLPGKKAE